MIKFFAGDHAIFDVDAMTDDDRRSLIASRPAATGLTVRDYMAIHAPAAEIAVIVKDMAMFYEGTDPAGAFIAGCVAARYAYADNMLLKASASA